MRVGWVRSWHETVENILLRLRKLETQETAIPVEIGNVSATATANVTLTTTFQLIPGTQITVPEGHYLIFGSFLFQGATGPQDNGDYGMGALFVDGVEQAGLALSGLPEPQGSNRFYIQPNFSWQVDVPESGAVFDLRARKSGGTGDSTVQTQHTRMSAIGYYNA